MHNRGSASTFEETKEIVAKEEEEEEGGEREDGKTTSVIIKGHKLNPALIVIDTQNGFVSDGGSYDKLGIDRSPTKEHYQVLPELSIYAREIAFQSIFIVAIREPSGIGLLTKTHKILPKSQEERINNVPICIRGTWDAQIAEEFKRGDQKYSIITKRCDSTFAGTRLNHRLRKMGIDSLIFCRFDTSMCV